jgi:hypothetical protein
MEAWAVLTPSGQNGPESGRKRTPSDVVNHEIVQGFEKHSVVPPLSPRREREAPNICKTIVQSASVMLMSMVGPPKSDRP